MTEKPAVPEYTVDPDRIHAVIGQQLMMIDQLRRELEARSIECNDWYEKYQAEKKRADDFETDLNEEYGHSEEYGHGRD